MTVIPGVSRRSNEDKVYSRGPNLRTKFEERGMKMKKETEVHSFVFSHSDRQEVCTSYSTVPRPLNFTFQNFDHIERGL